MLRKNTAPEPEPCLRKQRAPEPEPFHFYKSSAALLETNQTCVDSSHRAKYVT